MQRSHLLFKFAGLMFILNTPAVFAQTNTCADTCLFGELSGNARCELWNEHTGQWLTTIETGDNQLHNRARLYLP
ncbi:hypothetical protein HUU62_17135 [Rhodoferax sp. 4810]|uniref:Uncharacterized protein n=1 Tax=Thiospirillum jenense TaxID=1653858 RepID=A0A839HBK5_9GAMM|nr:hypothetical protein [Thiospirillum jenense]MBB1076133.1 hypothetical protein [Rhodoferax jenense]MBB1126081.1 hypothetical protein [Thiospirillum jenense]